MVSTAESFKTWWRDILDFKANTHQTIYSICDFPLNPRESNGWAEHIFKAEYLFLENIYSLKQLIKMKIEKYSLKLNKILDNFDEFCNNINQDANDEIKLKK